MSGLKLPEHLGVMILPECTLFPHGALPLRIFEEHYKDMLEEALQEVPMIAIACCKEDPTGLPELDAASVGTAGLIRACVRDDERGGQLILHGVIRVRFLEWLDEKSFPYARIEPVINVDPPNDSAEHRLRDRVNRFTQKLPDEVGQLFRSFIDKCDDPHIFADLVCHHLLQDPVQRQELLEMELTEQRLLTLSEMLTT